MTEDEARRVILLRAIEAEAPGTSWSVADRAWATRAAHDAPPERFIAERARHAFERLVSRDASLGRWLGRRHWRPAWIVAALLVGLIVGLAVDRIGPAQRIELLSPPLLGVLAWNLGAYLLLFIGMFMRRGRPWAGSLRRWLQRRLGTPPGAAGATRAASLAWAEAAAPLHAARAAMLLHTAAAALGAGLVIGLYARGLVLDYRAGWQSTFLDAATVHAWLAAALAPASALTGVAIPRVDVIATMRVVPGLPATAPAAGWIHLFAATLAIVVIVPRLLLLMVAAWRARALAADLPLPMSEPYFERLLRARRGDVASVLLVPHAALPAEAALDSLRRIAVTVFGADVRWRVAEPVPYGREDEVTSPPPPDTALQIALFDATATPEADQQGRLLDTLAASGVPRLAVVDEAAFARRFAGTPERLDERRAAWRRLAIAKGMRLVLADLERADAEALAAEFETALHA